MNPANALSQLSPGMAECHARLMAVAKHGTPEAFAGVLQRAELSISNAYDAGAKSIQVDAAAAPDAANEITKAFREYLTVHPGIKLGGHEADTVARELALIAQPAVAAGWVKLPGQLPEPGKPVLLDIGKKFPIRAMWAAKHTVQSADDDTDRGEYDEATDTYYCPEGWYEWNEHEDTNWAVSATPRAWATLPPTTSAGSGKGE